MVFDLQVKIHRAYQKCMYIPHENVHICICTPSLFTLQYIMATVRSGAHDKKGLISHMKRKINEVFFLPGVIQNHLTSDTLVKWFGCIEGSSAMRSQVC